MASSRRVYLAATCLLLTTFTSGGCTYEFPPSYQAALQEDLFLGPDRALHAALYTYRDLEGDWPSSLDELVKSDDAAKSLYLPLYKSLKLDRKEDGSLEITYEKAESPHWTMASKGTRTLPPVDSEARAEWNRQFR